MSAALAPSLVVALCLALATALALAPPARTPPASPPDVPDATAGEEGWLRRARLPCALVAGAGAWGLLGGPLGLGVGLGAAVLTWRVAGRVEPASARRERERLRRDLPHLVTLLGLALRGGADPAAAVEVAARALGGPAARRLAPVTARLRLGADPGVVWSGLGGDPALAPLGRALARAHATGAPVVATVDRLAEDLATRARAEVEDRARAVGVRAAVPLGLCLLPAFLLLGIVPVVAGLVGDLGL